jgi:TetR/AcrR family transcriptional regulator, regulator of cefoperazone and chloramphenicol sensitivity
MKSPRRAARGQAREKLLEAAIDLFGRRGYDGVSTREIAALAKVNLAGIAYNFGGKQGLYRSCIDHIAETVRAGLMQAGIAAATSGVTQTPESAAGLLNRTFAAMVHFYLGEAKLDRFVRLVVREQMDPTPAFDTLFHSVMEPLHRRVCDLWALATGQDSESEAVKLATLGIMGQVMVFRIARAGALRRLGWREIGEREFAAIDAMIKRTVDLSIAQARKERVP